MEVQKYVGKGSNISDAKQNLFDLVREAGVVNNPVSLEYTLKLGEYIYTNTDECLAFAGILEMAGIRVSAYNPKENPLEVSVRATYDIPKIKKEVQKAKAASPGIDHYVSIEETSDI